MAKPIIHQENYGRFKFGRIYQSSRGRYMYRGYRVGGKQQRDIPKLVFMNMRLKTQRAVYADDAWLNGLVEQDGEE